MASNKKKFKGLESQTKITIVFVGAIVILGTIGTAYFSTVSSINQSYKNEIARVQEEQENIFQTKCTDLSKELEEARTSYLNNFPRSGLTDSEIGEWATKNPKQYDSDTVAAAKKVYNLIVVKEVSCKEALEEMRTLKPATQDEYGKAQWKKILGFSS